MKIKIIIALIVTVVAVYDFIGKESPIASTIPKSDSESIDFTNIRPFEFDFCGEILKENQTESTSYQICFSGYFKVNKQETERVTAIPNDSDKSTNEDILNDTTKRKLSACQLYINKSDREACVSKIINGYDKYEVYTIGVI